MKIYSVADAGRFGDPGNLSIISLISELSTLKA
jgi:hypothetical protein